MLANFKCFFLAAALHFARPAVSPFSGSTVTDQVYPLPLPPEATKLTFPSGATDGLFGIIVRLSPTGIETDA